jgi:hypothetical protein
MGAKGTKRDPHGMPYRIASTLTFTDTYNKMTDDEQLAEQTAALEIVANNGGTIEAQYVLWSDAAVLSVVSFPDQQACYRCELQIGQRGAFVLRSQAALTIEEIMTLTAEAKAQATVKI